MSDLALICASCPEAKHDAVASICQAHKIQKAYGRTGDMVDSLAGKDWVAKWQAKVVMAAVTLASSMSVKRVRLICIQGGRFCNEEYKHTQLLKSAVEREWKDGMNEGKILVDVHWTDFDAFAVDYPPNREKEKSETSVKGKSARSPDEASSGTKHSAVSAAAPAPAPSRHGKITPPPAPTPTTTKSNRGPTKDIRSGDRSAIAEQVPEVPPAFACDECDKDFKSMEQLAQHLASTNHFEIKLKCKGCEKAFADKLRLKQHQGSTGHFGEQKLKVRQRDIAAEDDVWTCGECQREFKSELAWENHQQATGHLDPECPVCEKSFNSYASLEQHQIATQHSAIFWQFQREKINRTEGANMWSAAQFAAHLPARADRSDPAQLACPVLGAPGRVIDPSTRPYLLERDHSSLTLAWNKVAGAEFYELEMSTGAADWVSLSSSLKGTSIRKKNLVEGIAYRFRIRCYDGSVWTNYCPSSEEYFVLISLVRIMDPPEISARDDVSLTLQWKEITGAEGYQLRYRSDEEGATNAEKCWTRIESTIKSTTVRKKGLKAGVSYQFAVIPVGFTEQNPAVWSYSLSSAPGKVLTPP
jgi:hypothetical protein